MSRKTTRKRVLRRSSRSARVSGYPPNPKSLSDGETVSVLYGISKKTEEKWAKEWCKANSVAMVTPTTAVVVSEQSTGSSPLSSIVFSPLVKKKKAAIKNTAQKKKTTAKQNKKTDPDPKLKAESKGEPSLPNLWTAPPTSVVRGQSATVIHAAHHVKSPLLAVVLPRAKDATIKTRVRKVVQREAKKNLVSEKVEDP